jgi:uncharacterized protein YxjI
MSPVTFTRCLNTLKKLVEIARKELDVDERREAEISIDGNFLIVEFFIPCNRGCCGESKQKWFELADFEEED